MKKNFQYIILGIFIFFAIFAVLIFSGIFASKEVAVGPETTGPVVLWGVYPSAIMNRLIQDPVVALPVAVKYVEKNSATIEREFVEAMASGNGPDALLVALPITLAQKDKFFVIPSENLPVRTFRDTFTEGSELFLISSGVTAFPLFTDPMVMYWNRTLFNNAGISKVPTSWDEFLTLPEKLTVKDSRGNITQSAVALGVYRNVNHAKDIISTLLLQAGDPIMKRGPRGEYQALLGGTNRADSESAIRFFMDFSNPAKPVYSWNSALPESIDAFSAGTLAVYFGYASELGKIRAKNSHLDFDVAMIPQIKGNTSRSTLGQFYAIALVKNSPRLTNAYTLAQFMSFGKIASYLVDLSTFSSVRRDMLSAQTIDPYRTIFKNSAIISKGWLDVNPAVTDNIFRDMIDGIQVGRFGISQGLSQARTALTTLVAPSPQ